MEAYLLTLKVTLRQRWGNEYVDVNRTYDIVLPDFRCDRFNIDGYMYEIMDKLSLISGEYVSILYTDEGSATITKRLKQEIKDFQLGSLSSKAKSIYKWNDSFSTIQVYMKRL